MDAVRKDRRAVALEITRLEMVINGYDENAPPPLYEITRQEEKLNKVDDKCSALNERASAVAVDDGEFITGGAELLTLIDKISKLMLKLDMLKEKHPAAGAPGGIPTAVADIKLPKLELPTFSGEARDWLSFQDLFVASVHNNAKLAGAQKLQYLKASLKGEAATLLQNIQVTDLNYDGAWDTLKIRYENKREIIKSHFDRVLSLPVLNQENPDALRKIGDSINECIRALEVMKLTPEQTRDLLVIHLFARKFDNVSRLKWEETLKPDTIPTLKEFTDFILQHARVTAAAGIKSKGSTSSKPAFVTNKDTTTKVHHGTENTQDGCSLCKKDKHYLSKCDEFRKMNKHERKEYIMKSRRCFKCMGIGHRTQECTWKYNCRDCNEPHHTMIHFEVRESKNSQNEEPVKKQEQQEEVKDGKAKSSCCLGIRDTATTLLSTALIKIKNNKNQVFVCRALLDNGSQTSFITRKCATKIGLKTHRVKLPISGLGEQEVGTSQLGVELYFGSTLKSDKTFRVEAHIMNNITGDLPSERISTANWTHIEGLPLADPKFNEPGHIEVLLGGDIYQDLIKSRKRKGPVGTPWAIESHLGWILQGKCDTEVKLQPYRVHHATIDFVTKIQQYWELEEVPDKKILTEEEIKCERHFNETHSRDGDGRYVVKLPFKDNRKEIGESRSVAIKRLQSMERRYKNSTDKIQEYNDVLQGYLDLGHMQKVPDKEVIMKKENYYMPFHVVLNPNSKTTPVRVVFDGSAKSSTGVSLNECLMIGPTIQDSVVDIMMRFRLHPIVMSADIPKMYRQVNMELEDADYQRIVWRKSVDEPIQDYKLTTATFGTASAPYHAVRCVQHLAQFESENYPKAATVICKDFYVDDLMTGASTVEEAVKLKEDLLGILDKGKFELRKWSSNSKEFLETIPEELRETKDILEVGIDKNVKTLGLLWNPREDVFLLQAEIKGSLITKREILSAMAKNFDPLGWLSPVTVKAKILFQDLWKEKLDWDDVLPEEKLIVWKRYSEEMDLLQRIKIPRLCTLENSTNYYLDGYCDASDKAYAAVVYLRSENGTESISRLVAAKTKIAPLSSELKSKKKLLEQSSVPPIVTTPRLELCGAVLLRRLMQCVKDALCIDIKEINAWTDSTIVLGWIGKHPSTLKTFVGNRVNEIQELLPRERWAHISGVLNPADCASRGIYPSELQYHDLWWEGPPRNQQFDEEVGDYEDKEEFLKEIKPIICAQTTTYVEEDRIKMLIMKISEWNKSRRIMAYVLRFCNKKRYVGSLSVEELNEATKFIIKKVQAGEELGYTKEIENLLQKKVISKDLRKLNPFVDSDGLLRVGGRLEKAEVTYDKKHPVLLPSKHQVTRVIVRHYHKELQHAGSQLLLAKIQENFWIVGRRNCIKKIIRSCIVCTRQRAETCQQLMGQLPQARVNPARAFNNCGVDFAGPYILKNAKGRKTIEYKGYVVVFICLVTRAIHLELVSDMTSASFLETFKRFVAVRGIPSDVFSDCGTNFVGADRELKEYLKLWNEQELRKDVKNFMTNKGVSWHLNAPSAPHHGGIWEAGVKSMKFHLKRILGKMPLNFEEMMTLLKQIEACLNSRPLCNLSTDPSEVAALTPGHFLIGESLMAVPEPDMTSLNINRLSRWQKIQYMFQTFWRRWSSEYLARMQEKPKWWTTKKNLEIGNLVLIKDDNEAPLKWKMGRIIEVKPGDDGLVRVVKLKTTNGELTRPIVKLCLLPLD